jgi:hypothetical protein
MVVVWQHQKPVRESVVIDGSLAVGSAYHDSAMGGLSAFVAELLHTRDATA